MAWTRLPQALALLGAAGCSVLTSVDELTPAADPPMDAAADVPRTYLPLDAAPAIGAPPPPVAGTSPSPTTMTFVMDQVFLGDSDRNGAPSPSAWRDYGYDLDGKITTQASTDVCTPTSNTVEADGTSGIDNSFGAHILPMLQVGSPSAALTKAIAQGAPTTELSVTGLFPLDAEQTSIGLSATSYATGVYRSGGVLNMMKAPTFDLGTDWPVAPSEVIDGKSIASGAVHWFPSAYVNKGTFVIGPSASTFVWSYPFGSATWRFVVHHPVVTFDHVAPGQAANGVVAGVLDPSEVIASLKAIAGTVSMGLCGNNGLAGVVQQILQAEDILLDGTNSSGVPCDGISIGIGFHGVQIANPTQVSSDPVAANPCP